jgi:hypothetical protein
VLQAIDAVEALGIDPVVAAPEHWRHAAAVSAMARVISSRSKLL